MVVFLILILLMQRKILFGIITFGLFGFMHVFELYGKFFVEHRPPPHFMLRTQHPIQFPQFYVSAENSYPSGHSGRAVFITVILFFMIWRSKRLSPALKYGLLFGLFIYDAIMLVSRIYLGEHWTTDVIGGAIIALSLGSIAIATDQPHGKSYA